MSIHTTSSSHSLRSEHPVANDQQSETPKSEGAQSTGAVHNNPLYSACGSFNHVYEHRQGAAATSHTPQASCSNSSSSLALPTREEQPLLNDASEVTPGSPCSGPGSHLRETPNLETDSPRQHFEPNKSFEAQPVDSPSGHIVLGSSVEHPRFREGLYREKCFHLIGEAKHRLRPLKPYCVLPCICIATMVVLVAAIAPVYISYENSKAGDEVVSFPADLSSSATNVNFNNWLARDQISLVGRFQSIDPDSYSAVNTFVVRGGGNFNKNPFGLAPVPLGYAFIISIGGAALTVLPGQVLGDVSVDSIMREVVPRTKYPFDKYSMTYAIRCFLMPNAESNQFNNSSIAYGVPCAFAKWNSVAGYTATTTITPVAVAVPFVPANPSLFFGYEAPASVQAASTTRRPTATAMPGSGPAAAHESSSPSDSPPSPPPPPPSSSPFISSTGASLACTLQVSTIVQRSAATKFFSIFTVILMWALSLAIFALAVDHIFIKRAPIGYESPSLAIVMLFTLPFVRDTQPGVPPIGIDIDMLGFFWNMILIAITAVLLFAALSASRIRHAKTE